MANEKIINNTMEESIFGTFAFQKYYNKENGFSICDFKIEDEKKKITLLGTDLPIYSGVRFKFFGKWEENKYGKQFRVTSFEEDVKKEKNAIIAYLASGMIKGIGKKRAELIYEEFGDDTLSILDKNPESLLSVKGVGKKALKKIIESYVQNRVMRDTMLWLVGLGLTSDTASKIIAKFGNETKEKVIKNPYLLYIPKSISFSLVDDIALNLGIDPYGKERFLECTKYVLRNAERTGSLGMKLGVFGNEMKSILRNVPSAQINERTIELIKEKELYLHNKTHIFLKKAAEMEYMVAKNIKRIADDKNFSVAITKESVDALGKDFGFTPDDTQSKAVIRCMKNSFSVISGGPGTGKTSVIRLIIKAFQDKFPKDKIYLMAPTGRAARRMSEVTGLDARTIHSTLGLGPNGSNLLEEEITLEKSLIIVDEVSMVGSNIANKLLSAIDEGSKVIFVGDTGQLPSVEAGSVLRDIRVSGVIPIIFLTKVYRQSEKSQIHLNARKINLGTTDILDGDDFHFIEDDNMEEIARKMCEEYVQKVKEYGLDEVRILCPMKENAAGVYDINNKIQEMINPEEKGKTQITIGENIYRVGDLVMNLNNREVCSNGDIGRIEFINTADKEISVRFDTGLEIYDLADARDNLMLAYAMTVHKSQGSEYKAVITCLHKSHTIMLKRNLLYTGITRGKKDVTIYGQKEAMEKAINNTNDDNRITLLDYFLKYLFGQMVAVS